MKTISNFCFLLSALALAGCASPDTSHLTPRTALAAPASVPAIRNVKLAWNYPAAELAGIRVFKLYFSTNVAAPLTQWAVLTNVPAPNLTAAVPIIPQQCFFFCTASNFWGESVPSNTNALPAPPRFINSLTITP